MLTIISPLEGTPAQEAGVMPKDVIVKIDGEVTKDILIHEAVSKIRGKPGTSVVLTIWREKEGKFFDVTVMRAIIEIKSIKESLVIDDNIGYIKLVEFQEDTVKEFDGDPRKFVITKQRNEKPVIRYEKDRKKAKGAINPEGKVSTGYIDEDGNPVPDNKVDEDEKPQPVKIYAPDESLPDSAYVWTIGDDGNLYQVKKADIKRQNEELKLEKRREKMRELEKTPLMDLDVQTFHIGDSAYIRNKGEYKFRLNTKRVDSSNHRRKQDSLIYETPLGDELLDIVLDLREPDDYDYVRKLVDSMKPAEKTGQSDKTGE